MDLHNGIIDVDISSLDEQMKTALTRTYKRDAERQIALLYALSLLAEFDRQQYEITFIGRSFQPIKNTEISRLAVIAITSCLDDDIVLLNVNRNPIPVQQTESFRIQDMQWGSRREPDFDNFKKFLLSLRDLGPASKKNTIKVDVYQCEQSLAQPAFRNIFITIKNGAFIFEDQLVELNYSSNRRKEDPQCFPSDSAPTTKIAKKQQMETCNGSLAVYSYNPVDMHRQLCTICFKRLGVCLLRRSDCSVDLACAQCEEWAVYSKPIPAKQCIICSSEYKQIRFQCGHSVSCSGCSQKINLCPICRVVLDKSQFRDDHDPVTFKLTD